MMRRILAGNGSFWVKLWAASSIAQLGVNILPSGGLGAALQQLPEARAQLWLRVAGAALLVLVVGLAAGLDAMIAASAAMIAILNYALIGPTESLVYIQLWALVIAAVYLSPVILRWWFLLLWSWIRGWRTFTRSSPY
jgi:hypothetical protein